MNLTEDTMDSPRQRKPTLSCFLLHLGYRMSVHFANFPFSKMSQQDGYREITEPL